MLLDSQHARKPKIDKAKHKGKQDTLSEFPKKDQV